MYSLLIVDCRFDPLFRWLNGRCHGKLANFRVKIGPFTFIPKGIAICNIAILILKSSSVMIWLCVNLVKFGPVTPEFTKVKDVHPVTSGSRGHAPHAPPLATWASA